MDYALQKVAIFLDSISTVDIHRFVNFATVTSDPSGLGQRQSAISDIYDREKKRKMFSQSLPYIYIVLMKLSLVSSFMLQMEGHSLMKATPLASPLQEVTPSSTENCWNSSAASQLWKIYLSRSWVPIYCVMVVMG